MERQREASWPGRDPVRTGPGTERQREASWPGLWSGQAGGSSGESAPEGHETCGQLPELAPKGYRSAASLGRAENTEDTQRHLQP